MTAPHSPNSPEGRRATLDAIAAIAHLTRSTRAPLRPTREQQKQQEEAHRERLTGRALLGAEKRRHVAENGYGAGVDVDGLIDTGDHDLQRFATLNTREYTPEVGRKLRQDFATWCDRESLRGVVRWMHGQYAADRVTWIAGAFEIHGRILDRLYFTPDEVYAPAEAHEKEGARLAEIAAELDMSLPTLKNKVREARLIARARLLSLEGDEAA